MSITNKIWVSLGILLAGYFFSILFGFLSGINTEDRLKSIYVYLYPASHKSQAALTAFDEQIKLYQDAYLTGEAGLIDKAEQAAREASQALQEIHSLAARQQQEATAADDISGALERFTRDARKVYSQAITEAEAVAPTTLGKQSSNQQTIFSLAQTTKEIRAQLRDLQAGYNTRLERELSSIVRFSKQQRYGNLILFVVIAVMASLLIRFMVRRSITIPLNNAVDMVKDIAEGQGDLTKRLTITYRDEIGELAGWFNVFIDNMRGMTTDIISHAGSVRNSATDLTQVSGQMAENSGQMVDKSRSVTSAMEEMDASMGTIAAAMEQATSNTDTVASSTEEMSATITEIAQNSQNASNITQNAVTKSDQASRRVKELGAAADEIGKVTETINEISEQTNLLALNATIEAARAGEAGKGFAVVADEIKELARQTAEATLDIKDKIKSIQETSFGTVQDIGDISGIINTVNETVTIIASSVEEQSASTREIASNVSEISRAIGDVNENVSQDSTAISDITEDITNVNQRASDVSGSSAHLTESANHLSELADQLYRLVAKFTV
ncbi:MAG: methyl-accepting chemotaxis protein [Desulfosudaceae bacterium]